VHCSCQLWHGCTAATLMMILVVGRCWRVTATYTDVNILACCRSPSASAAWVTQNDAWSTQSTTLIL
jgi:hypothetical protein